jgi:Ca-activated chloride channel family protein
MVRPLLGLLAAGWIAQALASTDRDVDTGVEAYEAGEYEEALARFDAAQERLGERPEIHYDRGLALQAAGQADEAREAFERGTEADDARVRASSHYQLGNLSFDAEQWEDAIAQYTACLRAMPEHDNAKWNLELALQRKQQQEEEQEKQEQDQENQDQENQDQENQDQENQDQENQDQENQDQENQDQENQEDQEQEQEQEQQEQDEQEQDEQGQQEQEKPQPEPQPIDQADIDAALEQLDASDQFMLGRPMGRPPQVERDW